MAGIEIPSLFSTRISKQHWQMISNHGHGIESIYTMVDPRWESKGIFSQNTSDECLNNDHSSALESSQPWSPALESSRFGATTVIDLSN